MLARVTTKVAENSPSGAAEEAVEAPAQPRWRAVLVRSKWADLALLVVVVGTVARVQRWSVGFSLSMDEIAIALNVRDRGGLLGMAGDLDYHQSAPLGWMWAEWLVGQPFDWTERSLRFLSLVFAVGVLPLAWWIGRRWMGLAGALTLTGLSAFARCYFGYADEVKHYAADIFWATALVALAAWALDKRGAELRRIYLWWAALLLGSWLSMAAILVAPGFVVVLLTVLWHREGFRTAVRGALPGLVCAASFAVLYLSSLRYAVDDPFLAAFWSSGSPPRPLTLDGLLGWSGTQFEALARDPLLVRYAVIFWVLVAYGWVVIGRRRPSLAALVLAPVVSGWVLGVLGVVPLGGRLSLWIIPSLFIAIAAAVQAAAWWGADRGRELLERWSLPAERTRQLAARGVAVLSALAVLAVPTAFIIEPMYASSVQAPPRAVTHAHDRPAVRWLVSQQRPGDLVLAGFFYGTAIEWYADVDTLAPVKLVRNWKPGEEGCDPARFARELQGYERVIFYMGYPVESWFPQMSKVVPARLAELGTPVAKRNFSWAQVHIVDLTKGPSKAPKAEVLTTEPKNCLTVYRLGHPY